MKEVALLLLLGWSAADAAAASEVDADHATPTASTEKAAATAAPKLDVKKHTILFFTASRCPSCVRMKTQTLPRVDLPGHDLQMVDVDANPGLAQSYGVQSLPTYVVLDGLGRAYRQGVGFRDVVQFIDFLNSR
jgi:thioredoxin-related protein